MLPIVRPPVSASMLWHPPIISAPAKASGPQASSRAVASIAALMANAARRAHVEAMAESYRQERLGAGLIALSANVLPGEAEKCTAVGMDDFTGKPGLDVFYSVTPSLRLTATFNTDFGETEVDARQINLSRFSILFPEKRSFFLEGASSFYAGQRPDPEHASEYYLFFSRRIGLSDDGRAGRFTAVIDRVKKGLDEIDRAAPDRVRGARAAGRRRRSDFSTDAPV